MRLKTFHTPITLSTSSLGVDISLTAGFALTKHIILYDLKIKCKCSNYVNMPLNSHNYSFFFVSLTSAHP